MSTRSITIEDIYVHVGADSILWTTLYFEEGTRIDEIVDVNVAEKRKLGHPPQRRSVTRRIDTDQNETPSPPTLASYPPQQGHVEEIPDEEMSDAQLPAQPFRPRQSAIQPTTVGEAGRKFCLASDLSPTIGTDKVGEKVMDTQMQLSIQEIFAVSGEVAEYLHDQTRKRRVPIENRPAVPIPGANAVATIFPAPSVNANSVISKSYYALPSGHATVTLDNQLPVNATLDNGSEINMMSLR